MISLVSPLVGVTELLMCKSSELVNFMLPWDWHVKAFSKWKFLAGFFQTF